MLKEFKAFTIKGNAIDLATGVIIGGAFGKVVSSLVTDIIMPPVGLLLGHVDFSNLFISLTSTRFATLEEAKRIGAPTINYGLFINSVLDFLIVGFCVFMLVKQMMRFQKPADAVTLSESRQCPYCTMAIPLLASRCPNCTSQLDQAPMRPIGL